MLSRFMDRSVAWQLRAFAQEALHHTIGFGDHAWALRHPLAAAEQLRLADALCHWCLRTWSAPPHSMESATTASSFASHRDCVRLPLALSLVIAHYRRSHAPA
ncbi:MAG: hypothetical protein HC828_05660 [Blastochloris sp.]|nr:hypothetical protein [Blastochloris sp.]